VPALAVPQYWHLAAGFDEMFIAQAESRHRVRFALEQVVAALPIAGNNAVTNAKNNIFVFISLFSTNYIKKWHSPQKKKTSLLQKKKEFVFLLDKR